MLEYWGDASAAGCPAGRTGSVLHSHRYVLGRAWRELAEEPEPEPEPEPELVARVAEAATIPVEVSICCEHLKLMELTGSSRPVFAVLWLYRRQDRRWQEFGRTEVVRHHDCPSFIRSFQLPYLDNKDVLRWDELDQYVRIELYQHNSSSSNLKQHLCLGKVSFALRVLYTTPVKRLHLPFGPVTDAGHESCIVARIAPVDTARGAEPVEFSLEVAGMQELVRRDMCNPFLIISRYAFGQWEPFLQTDKRVLELMPVRHQF